MPTSYEVDTFLGEVDTFFQKKERLKRQKIVK